MIRHRTIPIFRMTKAKESIWSYKKIHFEINRNFRLNKMQDQLDFLKLFG